FIVGHNFGEEILLYLTKNNQEVELLSLLFGADNLRKLAVMAGLVLMAFGFLFPLQKNLELEEKKIQLEESRCIDSIAIVNLGDEVKIISIIQEANTQKVNRLGRELDSLMSTSLDENSKFKINFLQSQITTLDASDAISINEAKAKVKEIKNAIIRTESLKKEMENLDRFISRYWWFCCISCIGGFILLIMGLIKWNRSQKTSDDLIATEVKIKKEELKKIEKENNP
ncbi:MAG: hypothetical protein ACRCYO_01870, partial [Bacteroidia bacterium]